MKPKRTYHTPGDRFTVKHNDTSKGDIDYIKTTLGLLNTAQVIHMALRQFRRSVQVEEESREKQR